MNDQKCPVCGRAATRSAAPFSGLRTAGAGEYSVHCEECGQFCAATGFLAQGWSHVPAADKRAIAAYLKKTKDKQDCLRALTSDSWRYLAWQGKKRLAQHSG
jgi:hypothetical protein